MTSIGDQVKLGFDLKRGGTLRHDSFGLFDTVSVEVRRPVGRSHDHSQAYKAKEPDISHGSDWFRARGYLRSRRMGMIPVSYDIYTKVDGFDVTIDFKLLFEESLPEVEMVKSWCWVKAVECLVVDGEGIHMIPLLPAQKGWEQVYRGNLNEVTFTNSQGSFELFGKQSSSFVEDRIWKHRKHAEYVTVWFLDPNFPTIEEGKSFECTWELRYSEVT